MTSVTIEIHITSWMVDFMIGFRHMNSKRENIDDPNTSKENINKEMFEPKSSSVHRKSPKSKIQSSNSNFPG